MVILKQNLLAKGHHKFQAQDKAEMELSLGVEVCNRAFFKVPRDAELIGLKRGFGHAILPVPYPEPAILFVSTKRIASFG